MFVGKRRRPILRRSLLSAILSYVLKKKKKSKSKLLVKWQCRDTKKQSKKKKNRDLQISCAVGSSHLTGKEGIFRRAQGVVMEIWRIHNRNVIERKLIWFSVDRIAAKASLHIFPCILYRTVASRHWRNRFRLIMTGAAISAAFVKRLCFDGVGEIWIQSSGNLMR